MEELLKISDLSVEFKTERATVHALNGLNLTIYKGESLGLVGEAGAGKTTAALSILNLLPKPAGRFTGGNITYCGKSVFEMREKELENLRGNKISMIFQNPLTALNPVFTVGEQIAMVLRKHAGMNNKQAKARASELLEMVGIMGNRIKDYPNQFSGGMRQRVGIAAGLACNPELLIADEPTTALDVTIQAQILDLINRLRKKLGMAVLLITHDLGVVAETADRVVVMYCGRVVEQAKVLDLFTDPRHPYTRGLLDSIPKLDEDRKRLYMIKGIVPDPTHLPKGCAFADRCDHCMEKCREHMPALVDLGNGRKVRCFLESDEVEDQ